MSRVRTKLQSSTDALDCDLYRIVSRLETLYDATKRPDLQSALKLHQALVSLRAARTPLRSLMHEQDRKETV